MSVEHEIDPRPDCPSGPSGPGGTGGPGGPGGHGEPVELGEPIITLVPAAPPGAVRPRIVGPGRREREYLARVDRVEADLVARERELAQAAADLARRTRELAVAALIERGSVRAASKLEARLAESRTERERLQAAQNRLILALGAMQRENELLRSQLGSRVDRIGSADIAAVIASVSPTPTGVTPGNTTKSRMVGDIDRSSPFTPRRRS